MPRARARALFELCGQWIAEEPGRLGLYRFWNDAGTGRTRRASLGTSNLEEAKRRLAEIVVRGAPATPDSHLAIIFENYFLQRTDHLPSAKPARHAGRLFLECWGDLTKASAVNDGKLKDFVNWSVKRGNSISYIARNFSTLAAAMKHAKLHREIPMKAGAILDKWPDIKPTARRKIYEPTDEELARLLRQAMPESLRRWILNSMATIGRPTAVSQIKPAQRDRAHGLVALNPEGRRQNKKFRPTVREPRHMTKNLDRWEREDNMKEDRPYVLYFNRSSIKTALQRACSPDKANIQRMALYSIRHRGTTVLRNAKVPKEQIDYQLGHIQEGARTTQDYGQYEPEYLAEACAALNAWITRVLRLAARPEAKVRRAA